MKPPETVRSGPIWNSRRWCIIDTLLSGSCKTISDAVAENEKANNGLRARRIQILQVFNQSVS